MVKLLVQLTASSVNYQPSWFCEEYILDGKKHWHSLGQPGEFVDTGDYTNFSWRHCYKPGSLHIMHGKCMGTSLLSQKLAQNTNNQKIPLQNWTETPFAKHLVVLFVPSNRGKTYNLPKQPTNVTSLNRAKTHGFQPRWSIRGLTQGSRQSTTSIQWNAEWRHQKWRVKCGWRDSFRVLWPKMGATQQSLSDSWCSVGSPETQWGWCIYLYFIYHLPPLSTFQFL